MLILKYPYTLPLVAPIHWILELCKQYVRKISRRNKLFAISIAIALSAYFFVDRVFRPPRQLRHIPYQSYFSFVTSILRKENYPCKAKKRYLSIIDAPDSNGIYLTPDRMGWVVHVANPIDAKYILMSHDKFPKANVRKGFEHTLNSRFSGGDSMPIINGSRWKAQRKLANPAFKRSMPVRLFGRLTVDMFNVIEEIGDIIDVSKLMKRWTLDAIGNAGFGFDFQAVSKENNEWVEIYNTIHRGMQDPFFFFMPIFDTSLRWLFKKREAIHKDLERFRVMLDAVIIAKRVAIASGTNSNSFLEENERDLLTLMIEAESNGEGVMSDNELKSNLAIFLLAGHDTTSNTLTFAIYQLAKNQEIQQKAREEAISVLGDPSEDVLPTVEQTKEMTYINQIIKETLRLNGPSVDVFSRLASEDLSLSGTFVPKGSRLTVDIYNMHHSEKIWKNGHEFDPKRFEENGEAASLGAYSWIPFGGGPRQCIAMNFSLAEQRVLLSMFLRKYTWELADDFTYAIEGASILGLKDLKIKLSKRY